MIKQILNNADGLAIMYGYLAVVVAMTFIAWGFIVLVDFIRVQRREIKSAINRTWKQDGDYRI